MADFVQAYPGGVILALDQMRLYFQATLSRVWAAIGQTPVVRVSPQRDQVHFYGALEVRQGREIAMPVSEETSTASFLLILLLLLDRTPWHFGTEIDVLLADNDRLHLVYFPPAGPELNPQEHVWEQARDAIRHNHTYSRFDTLIDAFDTYLNQTPFDIGFMEKYAPPSLCQVEFVCP